MSLVLVCGVVHSKLSSFAIILLRKRELVAFVYSVFLLSSGSVFCVFSSRYSELVCGQLMQHCLTVLT